MKVRERYIEVISALPEKLFVRFKQECYRRRKGESKLIAEILEKVLSREATN